MNKKEMMKRLRQTFKLYKTTLFLNNQQVYRLVDKETKETIDKDTLVRLYYKHFL